MIEPISVISITSSGITVTTSPDYLLDGLTAGYVLLTLALAFIAFRSLSKTQASLDLTRMQIELNKQQSKEASEASERHSQATIDAVYKQIAASEAQFQQERFTVHLPLLIPEGAPKFQSVKSRFINRTANEQRISLHNVGPGVALNVASVLFGESYHTASDDARTYIHWTCWLGVPVAAGLVMKADHKLNRGLFDVMSMRIGSHTLNSPEPDPYLSLPNTLARITITYLDIFRRKHASIFDFVETDGWQLVEFLEDIPQDLDDLQFEVFNG